MSHVKLSEKAGFDLVRLYEFLAKYDTELADRANTAVIASFDILKKIPLGCPLLPGRQDLRKLVIAFGASGYIAFYSYDPITDTSTITKIIHQRERYNPRNL